MINMINGINVNLDMITSTLISFFTAILVMSIQATIVAVIVILFKKVFKFKVNVRIGYLLWALVLVRLLLPVLPESPVSIFNFTGFNLISKISSTNPASNASNDIQEGSSSTPFQESATGTSTIRESKDNKSTVQESTVQESRENHSTKDAWQDNDAITSATPMIGESVGDTSSIKSPALNILSILSYIWAIGVIIIAIYLIVKNIIFTLHLKAIPGIGQSEDLPKGLSKLIKRLKSTTGMHRPIKFVEVDEITSPCVYGVMNCAIILPKGLLKNYYFSNDNSSGDNNVDDIAIFHILAHEFAHIKHYDLAVCWLISLICAVHWFNPVIWYCSKLIRRDQELCADAYAMSLMDKEDYIKYGQTLLSLIKKGKRQPLSLVAVGISENKNALKERIINIAAFTKNKYRFTLTSLLAILIAALFLCTSRMNYPRTAEERMKFDDNILMSFMFNDKNNPGNMELLITNNNDIAVHSCQLEVYDTNPHKSDSIPIYEKKNFRVGAKKSVKINLVNADYNNAYARFSYKVGFALDNQSNMIWREGILIALDDTIQAIGWSSISDEEVNSFIEENDINVTAINKIYDLYTIVSFENGNWQGYYELCRNSEINKLSSRRVIGYSQANNRPPVQRLGGTASGNFPFIHFKINSRALLALGDKIEIQTSNGIIVRYMSSGEAVHAVETRGYGNIGKILIYDRDNKLIYDGEKVLLEDVSFKPDDASYKKIMHENGYKIINQSPISREINFTPGMFPDEYVVAYKSDDIDWKIPLFTYENTTVYLKSIVESNESPDRLYALFYFVHDVDRSPGNILSSTTVNFRDGTPYSYSWSVNVKRDVFSSALKTTFENVVSLRSTGPGDQMAIYLDRSMVEKTEGKFTVTLEGLNLVSYVPESQYVPFDEQKKKQVRDMVYNWLVNNNKIRNMDILTGTEEIYATVGRRGQKVVDPDSNEQIDVSGKYVYYVSFHTEQDGLLGPITALVNPKTEKIIGIILRE